MCIIEPIDLRPITPLIVSSIVPEAVFESLARSDGVLEHWSTAPCPSCAADWRIQIRRVGQWLCWPKSLLVQILPCHLQLEPKKSERLHKSFSLMVVLPNWQLAQGTTAFLMSVILS